MELTDYGQRLRREHNVCAAADVRHKAWLAKRPHWKPKPHRFNPFSQTESSLAERHLSNMRIAVITGR